MAQLNLPDGQATVKVTIIDSGARIKGPLSFFLDSSQLDYLYQDESKLGETLGGAPAYVFLVEHEPSGRRILFDLGIRKNLEDYSPAVKAYFSVFQLEEGEEVSDFLRDRGVDLNTIEAIVWSHHHFDHLGNPAGFPPTTDLMVGPGFKETMLPGYPKNPESQILECDYEGRNLRQINFEEESNRLTIGDFRAFDYFGDGSFYLLQTPGHTIDHLSGLARTSASPSSKFIFMGGDIGHHASQWRPTELLPLPNELAPSPLGPGSKLNVRFDVCPGELFIEHAHPHHSGTTSFHKVKAGLPYDADAAQRSLTSMQPFDADENVLVVTAHDCTLLPVLKYWPEDANGWHKAGWKALGRWEFLKDFSQTVEEKAGPKSG